MNDRLLSSWRLWGPILCALLVCSCSDSRTATDASVDRGVKDAAVDRSSSDASSDGALPDTGRDLAQKDAPLGDAPLSDALPSDSTVADAAADMKNDSSFDATANDVAVEQGIDSGLPPFFTELEGLWLIGWSGGLHHYSWVVFEVTSVFGGNATILDGSKLSSNSPFFNCNGATTFNLASRPRTVQLHLPSATCHNGLRSVAITFEALSPSPSFPRGATHGAVVTIASVSVGLSAFKFPRNQCDAKMSSCIDPL
jgi:hypothetical protein